MIPWKLLDSVKAPGGSTMSLTQRDTEFVIRVDGDDLMNSRIHGSEDALGSLGCAGLREQKHVRVLIGGLGMGFTARAVLDSLSSDAQVDVCELVPAVAAWNRGPLAHLAKNPLGDRRVRLLEEDVGHVIARSNGIYHAILMDVDNGPAAMTTPTNAGLYGVPGLQRAHRALRPRGVFAVWSAFDAFDFTRRLRSCGFETKVEHVRAHAGKGSRHLVWIAQAVPPPTEKSAGSGKPANKAAPRRPANRRY